MNGNAFLKKSFSKPVKCKVSINSTYLGFLYVLLKLIFPCRIAASLAQW